MRIDDQNKIMRIQSAVVQRGNKKKNEIKIKSRALRAERNLSQWRTDLFLVCTTRTGPSEAKETRCSCISTYSHREIRAKPGEEEDLLASSKNVLGGGRVCV